MYVYIFFRSAVEYPYIYRISYMYYGVIGFTITFIFGYLLSILLKSETRKKIRPNLLCHIIAERLIQKRSSMIEMVMSFHINVANYLYGGIKFFILFFRMIRKNQCEQPDNVY